MIERFHKTLEDLKELKTLAKLRTDKLFTLGLINNDYSRKLREIHFCENYSTNIGRWRYTWYEDTVHFYFTLEDLTLSDDEFEKFMLMEKGSYFNGRKIVQT